jgi:predicted metal-dependent hydrolase
MKTVDYGSTKIQFHHLINDALKHAYVSVDPKNGVTLKAPSTVTENQAKQIVKKRGAWILKKLEQVRQQPNEDIVSGSRIPYLGKKYIALVNTAIQPQNVIIKFSGAKFHISVKDGLETPQTAIIEALNSFYLEKVKLKIQPRIDKLSKELGLIPKGVIYKKMSKRWGSCTKAKRLVINSELVKLSYSLIDYVIVHELVHLKFRDHNRRFWGKVEDILPEYRKYHEKLEWMAL